MDFEDPDDHFSACVSLHFTCCYGILPSGCTGNGTGGSHHVMGSWFGLHCLTSPPYLRHGRPYDSCINFWAPERITCETRETQTKKKNKKTTQHQSARWSAGLLVKNAGGDDLFLPMSIGPKILLFRLKFVLPYFWTEQRDMPKSVLRRLVISLE